MTRICLLLLCLTLSCKKTKPDPQVIKRDSLQKIEQTYQQAIAKDCKTLDSIHHVYQQQRENYINLLRATAAYSDKQIDSLLAARYRTPRP